MRVRLEVSEEVGSSRGARVLTEICNPEGKVRGGFAGYASVEGRVTVNRGLFGVPDEHREFVIEADRWTVEDDDVLKRVKTAGVPAIALLNKVDLVSKDKKAHRFSKFGHFCQLFRHTASYCQAASLRIAAFHALGA